MPVENNEAQVKQSRNQSWNKENPFVLTVEQRNNERYEAEHNIDFVNNFNRTGFVNERFHRKILCRGGLRQEIRKLFFPTFYPERLKNRFFKFFGSKPTVSVIEVRLLLRNKFRNKNSVCEMIEAGQKSDKACERIAIIVMNMWNKENNAEDSEQSRRRKHKFP